SIVVQVTQASDCKAQQPSFLLRRIIKLQQQTAIGATESESATGVNYTCASVKVSRHLVRGPCDNIRNPVTVNICNRRHRKANLRAELRAGALYLILWILECKQHAEGGAAEHPNLSYVLRKSETRRPSKISVLKWRADGEIGHSVIVHVAD